MRKSSTATEIKRDAKTGVFYSIEKIYTLSSIKALIKRALRVTIIAFKKITYATSLALSMLTTLMVFNWKWDFLNHYTNLTQYCFVFAAAFFVSASIYLIAFVLRELLFERGYVQ